MALALRRERVSRVAVDWAREVRNPVGLLTSARIDDGYLEGRGFGWSWAGWSRPWGRSWSRGLGLERKYQSNCKGELKSSFC